jgi:hypothetical protein
MSGGEGPKKIIILKGTARTEKARYTGMLKERSLSF